MASIPFDLTEDIHPAAESQADQSLLEEIDLLTDVRRGLADVEAKRVVPHEEARSRLLARYQE
jgi:predicted transcriptional regulator